MNFFNVTMARAVVVYLKFRAGSTFPFPVCTVRSSIDRTSRYNKVDAVRLYDSYRLNSLLLKGQRCVMAKFSINQNCKSYEVAKSYQQCGIYLTFSFCLFYSVARVFTHMTYSHQIISFNAQPNRQDNSDNGVYRGRGRNL